MRRKGRARERRKRKKRERREKKEGTCNARIPVYIHARTRDRRAAANFAFCSRCLVFYMRPIASLFQHPFYHPPALGPYTPRPSSRLMRPVKKKRTVYFLPSLFFARQRCMPPSVIFEALFPRDYLPRRYLRCKSKRAPFLSVHFFYGASLHRSISDSENR